MNVLDWPILGGKSSKLCILSMFAVLVLNISHLINFKLKWSRYEASGLYRRKVKAQQLWFAVIESQIETGTPYILYKDACNRKSNQQNLGTIKCSNLCTEIVEYSSPDEVIPSLPFLN